VVGKLAVGNRQRGVVGKSCPVPRQFADRVGYFVGGREDIPQNFLEAPAETERESHAWKLGCCKCKLSNRI